MYLIIGYFKTSCFIINKLNEYIQRIGRKNTGSFFGPFHQAGITTVQTIFHPGPEDLFFTAEPVKIDMKEYAFCSIAVVLVFIDNRKSGASHCIFHSFCITQCMNKSCFTRPHRSMESNNSPVFYCLPELFCNSVDIPYGKDPFHPPKLTDIATML